MAAVADWRGRRGVRSRRGSWSVGASQPRRIAGSVVGRRAAPKPRRRRRPIRGRAGRGADRSRVAAATPARGSSAASADRAHGCTEFARRGSDPIAGRRPITGCLAHPRPTGRRRGPGRAPVQRAAWNTIGSSEARRSIARPGSDFENMAGRASPTTSRASLTSLTRNARRRSVLARMSSVTTPAGRCVASTMCTPRLRPRCAIATSARRKSGRSWASVANSSMTTTSRGIGSTPAHLRYSARSATRRPRKQSFTSGEFGFEADEGTMGEPVVEVGHQADGVWKIGTRVERRASLVVDEHEVEVHRADPRRPWRRRGSAATRSCPTRSFRPRGRAVRRPRGRPRPGPSADVPIGARSDGSTPAATQR